MKKNFFHIMNTNCILFSLSLTSILSISCSSNNNLQTQDLASNGGTYNSLQVDKYLSIIELIKLNNNTLLSSLSNDLLTKKLRLNSGYENLSLSILENSNELDGKLVLNLKGNFNNKEYNEIITVNGFINASSDFEISSLNLNLENYFNNSQPIENSNLSISNDLNVIKSIILDANFNFQNNQEVINFDIMQQNYLLKKITVNLQNKLLNFKFEFETKFKKYLNNEWVLIENQKTILNTKPFSIAIPSLKTLMQFMIEKFTLDQEKFKNYYPSYFKGLFNMSVDLKVDKTNLLNFINYQDIIQKYKNTYFPQSNIYPQLDISSDSYLLANDYNNSLSFKINLINSEDENNLSITKIFELNNLKNIDSFLEEQKNQQNIIIIKNDSSSTLANNIKKSFKNEINKIFIENKLQNINITPNNSFLTLLNTWSYIFNYGNQSKNIDYAEKINKNYFLSLFNQELSNFNQLQGDLSGMAPLFDIDSGIFKNLQDEMFMIENINLEFSESELDFVLEMPEQGQNYIFITFNAKMKMNISQKEYVQETKFNLIITKFSWINETIEEQKNELIKNIQNTTLMFDSTAEINKELILTQLKKQIMINPLFDLDLKSFSIDKNTKTISCSINFFGISNEDINKEFTLDIKYDTYLNSDIIKQLDEYSNQIIESFNGYQIEINESINLDNNSVLNIIKEYLEINMSSDYDINIISFVDDKNNKILKTKLKVFYKKNNSLFKDFNLDIQYELIPEIIPPINIPLDEIINKITLIPSTNPSYKNISAKEFYKLPLAKINEYFSINMEDLIKEFGQNVINSISIVFTTLGSFDFNKPRTVMFQISVQSQGKFEKKEIEFNDFKEDLSLIGELDSKPIRNLQTPSGSTSYKGKLERFLINEIKETSENQYVSNLKQMTWEAVKLDFMYQVRFMLYQCFSDNFSEINYYISNEVSDAKFSAIAEGIVKEDKNNVYYGPLVFIGSPGLDKTSNLKSGDRIKIQIDFDAMNSSFKPSLIDRGEIFGEFTYSWWWNFKDNCNNLRNDEDPLYVKDLPRNSWSSAKNLYIKINNNTQIGQTNIQQYNSWGFVFRNKIPKIT